MYLRPIETTVSIMGHVVYLNYWVTNRDAVQWTISLICYGDPGDCEITGPGIDLLESLLRTHWSGFIEQRLLAEFEARLYEEEAKLSAQAELQTPYDY